MLTRLWSATISSIIMSLLWTYTPPTAGVEGPDGVDFWRSARNCGPNCLYLMLSGTGNDVKYEDLVAAVDVGPRGTTLPQLRDAAQSLGYDLVIYKCSPQELGTIRLPVIVHLDRESGDVSGTGHFVVLTEYNETTRVAQVFDGTTGSPELMDFETLRRMWSGYLLGYKPQSKTYPFLISMGSTMAACAVVRLLGRRRKC